jgi:hypothetical protein
MDENLWPEFGEIPKTKTPLRILKEQAEFLNERTKGILKAEVSSGNIYNQFKKNVIVHTFKITAPFLGDYSFVLLRLQHDVMMYPSELIFNLGNTVSYNIADEKILLSTLSEIFADKLTLEVINNLLIQSQAAKEDQPDY